MKRVFLFLVFCVACAPVCTYAAQQAIVEHFVGTEGGIGSRDGRGAIARFNLPHGVWTDGTFAYVADQNNSTIRKITIATGDVTTIAGTPQQPQAGRIERPSLVWGDASFLYFVDGPTIRRLAMATGEITTLAGSTFGLKDGVGPEAQFRGPYAITGNSSRIYVLEPPIVISSSIFRQASVSPGAIREISPSSGEVRTLTPAGLTFGIDRGMLWADDDFLYLTYGTTLGRIRLSDLQFEALLSSPSLPAGTQNTAYPSSSSSLWGDGLGNLFFNTVTDIYRVALSTGEFSVVASAPPATRRAIGGISGFGNMLVATDQTAQVVFGADLVTKQVTTIAGLASVAPSPDQESPALGGANGLWRRGNFFYVADTDRSLIYKIAADTGELSTFVSNIDAPAGLWGDENFLYVTQSRDNKVSRLSWQTGEISALNAELPNPTSITGDSAYLYIVYQRRSIARISKADGAKTAWNVPGAGSADIAGLWTDGSILYLVDSALRKMDLSTNQVVTLAALPRTTWPLALWSDGKFVYVGGSTEIHRFDPGSAQFTTLAGAQGYPGAQDGIGETARLYLLGGMWGDAQYLYFTDRSFSSSSGKPVDGRLRRLNLATREVITLAGRVLLLSEGHIPSEQFEATSVTGGAKFLYATSGNAVYKISLATREITHLAGAFNESGTKDGIGSEARFWYPTASFSLGRNLFVADQVNQAVRQIDVDTGRVTTILNGVTLPVVWGDTNYLYVAGMATKITFDTPPNVAAAPSTWIIQRVDLTTREVKTFATGLPEVAHLWGDKTNLYVAETSCTIRRISLSTAEISLLAGSSSECKWPYPPSNPPALVDGSGTEARFGFLNAIWGDGRILYISDGYTLRTVDPMTGETHTIAGDWRIYGNENGVGADARFFGPNRNGRSGLGGKRDNGGIWGDGTYLYVADRAIRRVTIIGPTMASVNFEVRSGGGNYWKSSTPDPLQVGYARLQPSAGSPQPNGMVIFSFRSQGILVSEASVPASPLIQAGRVYAETGGAARTGIAIANPNDSDATISFYFTDTSGVDFASGVTTIPAKQQIAAFLDEAPFNGTAGARSFTFTSSVPVGAIALRGYLNERSDFLMTTLPVAPVSSSLASAAVLPHFASGGGWTTQILLVNPTDDPIAGTVEMDATYTYSIAPRSAAKVVSSNPGTQTGTGFVRINPAGGSPAPVASSVFSFVSAGVTVSESGVAATGAGQAFRIFAEVDSAQSMQTGIAVANLGFNTALVQAELLTLDGQASGFAGLLNIPTNGHRALFLGELPGFQNLPASFRGVLRISSNTPISVMGMRERYNERGDLLLSAVPAIADDASIPSGELLFPHIVTGGGYTTEFLLLNRSGGTSAGTVSLRSQSGADLALPIIR